MINTITDQYRFNQDVSRFLKSQLNSKMNSDPMFLAENNEIGRKVESVTGERIGSNNGHSSRNK
jgi:hypothetical protein